MTTIRDAEASINDLWTLTDHVDYAPDGFNQY
jgi:hypothetical protein